MKRIVAAQTCAGKFPTDVRFGSKGETCAVRWLCLLRANSRHSRLWAFAG